jgi:hypothetical protein
VPQPAPRATSALPRRAALALAPVAAALALALPAAAAPAAAAEAAEAAPAVFVVRLGPDDPASRAFGSVSAALEAAPAGATVRVEAGYYGERLVVTRPVTLEAAPGAEGRVVVEHQTEAPYEATLQVDAPGVRVRGFKLRHASPSVASDYCVLVRAGGAAALERCDVSSATGSGLGAEGGVVTATACRLADCKLHGAAFFGDLGGESAGECALSGCQLEDNGACGALVRDGAAAALRSCTLANNAAFGLEVVDAAVTLVGCTVRANRKGALLLERPRGLDMEANAIDVAPVVRGV